MLFDEEKFNLEAKRMTIIAISIYIIFMVAIVFTLKTLSSEISDNGGLGKSIGKFIGDIKSEIN